MAIAGVVLAAASFVFMFVAMPEVDFLRHPVSIYENKQPGFTGYIIATAGIAVSCTALALTTTGWPRLVLATAALAFVVAAVFPTDPGTGVDTVAGYIHRYASGTGFGLVIIAGFLAFATTTGWRRPALLWLSVTNVVLMALVVINTFFPTFADGRDWRGLPQRLLLFTLAAVLVMLASNRASTAGSRRPREADAATRW
ncbi:hypothetical protein Snas_2653 [Stackebrandtia nassauensis DSM 44728]|uniref:DUF998 domain-containing protein n=1 Tax=Stackebrandtia nassauensis (strain DSM 44728 / CIP 108903 / NRRL B-16338 / NBRC 102104 / LLR-40K-21) TaxID=446470 RepID=D3Q759_STANL|nr:hypothetical protein Snas_2653 [Stackebrandtia nassauensis DSM 44728]